MKRFVDIKKTNFSFKRRCSSASCQRRVVCTGIGIVSPLGCGSRFAWEKLVNGHVGVVFNDRPGFESIPSKVAAFVPLGNNLGEFYVNVAKNDMKFLSQSMLYALSAADFALEDSGWKPNTEQEKQRTGVAVGSGMVDLEAIANTSKAFSEFGYKRVSPYFVPRILINLAAGHISIKYGFQGPNHAVSTACTTGAHSIGDSMRLIKNGDADVMVCGGTDAAIVPVAVAGFSRARALSTAFFENPSTSSRPFDSKRDGFVIGEGAAILVLEEYQHAIKRNAKLYGEIMGYGMSGDGYHMTAPREDGIGAYLCMKAALRDAKLTPDQIQYVNAHATSTPIGDAVENRAIKKCFGKHAYSIKISSFKGAIGHLLGAAGAVETAFTLLALYHKVIPPTMNLFSKDGEFDLNYVSNEAVPWCLGHTTRRIALKNSFGFGGTNASLCLGEIQ
ncbi:3-oxoacyl-[acyl-carrier-protein] synthase, mitochondrial [Hydra vulgaris]|uniref:3-oxoacyl-[acyl-carrier-protein] synthase n=1 Tax=Hydra vulgaris TaxID=6087 RepID=A0ABM4BLL6_HYDVU